MKLCKLLDGVEYKSLHGEVEKEIEYLTCHSKDVKENSLFFAIEGCNEDGHKYVDESVKNGAIAIILGKIPDNYDELCKFATIIVVEDVRKALAQASCQFYNNPSEHMQVIGVTGTKGKTSVTFMIRHILEMAGIKTGIIGTVYLGCNDEFQNASETTPDSIKLQKTLAEMLQRGCKAVVMEVSSQGLMQERVHGIDFNIGVFTNIFPDHIGPNEHRDFEHYLECKSKLFDLSRRAVINGDDEHWHQVIGDKGLKQRIFFGTQSDFEFSYSDLKCFSDYNKFGLSFKLKAKAPFDNVETRRVFLNTFGKFNIENALAAIATTRALGVPWEIIIEALKTVKIPGRMEVIPLEKDFTVMVDYAHNGGALKNVLEALREYKPNRLIVVFGCGGNRDKNRRFEMGRVAFEMADYIVVTSDNPRSEDPDKIIEDITSVMKFCKKVILVIPDRSEAIKRAILDGKSGDIIVIAGKGHETYQIIGDDIIYFDDKQVVLSCGKD